MCVLVKCGILCLVKSCVDFMLLQCAHVYLSNKITFYVGLLNIVVRMPPKALVFGLPGDSASVIILSSLAMISCRPINRLAEFHQIYNVGAVGDEDKLIRF